MKQLIIYSSNTGATEHCARLLTKYFPDATLHKLTDKGNPRPDEYDMVIVGGFIRGGGLSPLSGMYLEECEDVLLTKQLGIFICCGDDSKADEYFRDNVSETLIKHARACMSFGGEINPENAHGIIDKTIVRNMAKSAGNKFPGIQLHTERIEEFAAKMQDLPRSQE